MTLRLCALVPSWFVPLLARMGRMSFIGKYSLDSRKLSNKYLVKSIDLIKGPQEPRGNAAVLGIDLSSVGKLRSNVYPARIWQVFWVGAT
jgi:hypothetical protein